MRKKILFILPTLNAGGAERVFSFIAQNLDSTIYESSLLIVGRERDAKYNIENIKIIFLEKSRVLYATTKIFMFLLNHKPHVVLSSIGHLNVLMGLMSPFFPKTKFIIREASVISAMNNVYESNESGNILWKLGFKLDHISYKLINTVVCQSKDMANDFIKIYKIPEEKISIINNPITQSIPLKSIQPSRDSIVKFITVGRLSQEKGHIRIIRMLSKLRFEFHYTIIGKGPYETEVFNEIEKYSLNKKITHIPFTDKVSDYMALNDLFLQGSYVEGFPNTVLESCYVGTPVIAFDVPGGTKEIIEHKINGYLVKTEEDYLFYLNNRIALSPDSIRSSVEKKFNKEKIINEYEELFN